jgi:fatty acid desaturase
MRRCDGASVAVLAYVVVGYCVGMYMLLSLQQIWLAIPLVAHTMTFAAYLIHEIIHGTLFGLTPSYARWLGKLLLHICGSPYADYGELRYMHLLHHSAKADTSTFDYKALLAKRPLLNQTVVWLEWVYFPAVDWIAHARVFATPFFKRNWRAASVNTFLLAGRLATFLWLAHSSRLLSLVSYVIAFNGMTMILRLGDCFQHTYDAVLITTPDSSSADASTMTAAPTMTAVSKDASYEQDNTYSTIFPDHAILNFLLHLNFGFHSVHHHRTTLAWYELPLAHAKFHSTIYPQKILSMWILLERFHSRRIERISTVERSVSIGFLDVSFLTDIQ